MSHHSVDYFRRTLSEEQKQIVSEVARRIMSVSWSQLAEMCSEKYNEQEELIKLIASAHDFYRDIALPIEYGKTGENPTIYVEIQFILLTLCEIEFRKGMPKELVKLSELTRRFFESIRDKIENL